MSKSGRNTAVAWPPSAAGPLLGVALTSGASSSDGGLPSHGGARVQRGASGVLRQRRKAKPSQASGQNSSTRSGRGRQRNKMQPCSIESKYLLNTVHTMIIAFHLITATCGCFKLDCAC